MIFDIYQCRRTGVDILPGSMFSNSKDSDEANSVRVIYVVIHVHEISE